MNEYEEKKQARIKRYREHAAKAQAESDRLYEQSHSMASVIPMGQPIHGAADRRYRDKIGMKMEQSIKAGEKAEYYEHKARAAENNRAISSDDPEALSKLKNKLDVLTKNQEEMKRINAYYRKHQTCRGCEGVSPQRAADLDNRMAHAMSWETAPFPSYVLTNNNAEIRRLKSRIKELKEAQTVGFCGWEFDGGRVEANSSNNRLQIFFDDIPPEEVRRELKSRGFHWSRNESAWQRQLTDNAVYAASRISSIQPSDGSDPRKIQPKHKKEMQR